MAIGPLRVRAWSTQNFSAFPVRLKRVFRSIQRYTTTRTGTGAACRATPRRRSLLLLSGRLRLTYPHPWLAAVPGRPSPGGVRTYKDTAILISHPVPVRNTK